MDTSLFKFVTAGIRARIVTIIIYVIFCEPNGTLGVDGRQGRAGHGSAVDRSKPTQKVRFHTDAGRSCFI
jgi:hypothetical protein